MKTQNIRTETASLDSLEFAQREPRVSEYDGVFADLQKTKPGKTAVVVGKPKDVDLKQFQQRLSAAVTRAKKLGRIEVPEGYKIRKRVLASEDIAVDFVPLKDQPAKKPKSKSRRRQGEAASAE